MSDPEAVRRALLRAAARVLLAVEEAPSMPPPDAQVVAGEHFQVRVEVRPVGEAAAGSRQVAGPHLTRLDRQILAAAMPQFQSKAQLADACDMHDVDSYFAGRVRRLKGLGLLETDGQGGYRLA